MRTSWELLLILFVIVNLGWGQTRLESKATSSPQKDTTLCGMDGRETQEEMKELSVHVSRMESRIVMIRNSAGTIQDPQVRNALQVDADMWQDEVEYERHSLERMQAVADRCEARERMNQSTK